MMVNPRIAAATATALVAFVGAWELVRLSDAKREFTSASDRLAQTTADVREVLDLRAKSEAVAVGRRPEQDMLARVNDALTAAGLPGSSFVGQSQESDASVVAPGSGESGGPAYRKQVVRLSLKSLLPRELGAFLAVWRAKQPAWVPARIDLAHAQGGSGDRYDATILLAAVYLEEPGKAGARASGGAQ